MQKAELTNQTVIFLTAFKGTKHDDEFITVLLIKNLDNYNKKVYKRKFYQIDEKLFGNCMHFLIINHFQREANRVNVLSCFLS